MVSERESIILFLIVVVHVVIRVSELAEEIVLLLLLMLLGRPTKIHIILVLLRVINIEIIKLVVYCAEVVCLGLLHGIASSRHASKIKIGLELGHSTSSANLSTTQRLVASSAHQIGEGVVWI